MQKIADISNKRKTKGVRSYNDQRNWWMNLRLAKIRVRLILMKKWGIDCNRAALSKIGNSLKLVT